jgi:hypothetical protein
MADIRMMICGKDLERSGSDIIGVIFRHFQGGNEEDHETTSG